MDRFTKGRPVRSRPSVAVIVAALALIAGCRGGDKGDQPSNRSPGGAKTSGIYGVPVPPTAELDKAASPQGTETYRVRQGNLLSAFYAERMPVGRPFNGLDFCGQRMGRPVPPPPGQPVAQLVWRKRGTYDLLVLSISGRAGTVTIVDDRNDRKPPCR